MKKNCISCGKGTSHFDMPLELVGDQVLCRKCADNIIYDINKVYENMPEEDFCKIKEKIIDDCQNKFSQDILSVIIATINNRYGILENEDIQKTIIEQENLKRERWQQEYQLKIDNLDKLGLDGYYEYKVLSLLDEVGFFRKNSGKVDTYSMTEKLNELGIEGWHLVTAYSNELGKNALSGGVGGAMLGVNSTVDENILIFERFVRINKE